MPWWAWMLLGAALFVGEMFSPGSFFLLFFGVAAVVVGALAGVGAGGEPWLQWLLFSIVSVASLIGFRGRLLARFQTSHASTVGTDGLVSEVAVLLDDLPVGGVAKAELRGTAWSVRSGADRSLARGERCRVERVEGLTLWVSPES